MTRKRIDQCELGFRLGIAVAVGIVVNGFDQQVIAKEILASTGLTVAKAKTADVTEYDLRAIRKAWS